MCTSLLVAATIHTEEPDNILYNMQALALGKPRYGYHAFIPGTEKALNPGTIAASQSRIQIVGNDFYYLSSNHTDPRLVLPSNILCLVMSQQDKRSEEHTSELQSHSE